MLLQTKLNTAKQLLATLSRRKRKGFTLIELLVVVVIIGILASIALPSFVGAQDKARNASVQSNVNTVRLALEQYSTDRNGAYPTTTADITQLTVNNYLPGNKVPRSPWATSNQTVHVPITNVTTAANLAAGTPLTTLPRLAGAAGAGIISQTPSLAIHYGSIEYENEPNSATYIVTGSGKRNKDAVITAQSTNNGS